MIYVKNVPVWERVLRVGVSGALAGYGLVEVGGFWGVAILAAAIGLALTGLLGFCPACAFAGRRLKPRPRDESGPRAL
ncbi:DUF2892 domain-containing protein [Acidiferrobacter sp.]|uniref:YgaP family membrane protein n=1 Tax=Acidiferrobacter sp. TaxID=1872107 RepID=UPI00261BCBD4|nr:DUF2892 domain-containing protein [Acidiferrobacter sp.]